MPSNQQQRTLLRLLERSETLIAADTEFRGSHTLTIQLACRAPNNEVLLQVYHSPAIPGVPRSLDLASYLSTDDEYYGRFVPHFRLRRPAVISSGLTPVQWVNDLFRLTLTPVSLEDGRIFSDAPKIQIVVVGHFLQADFGRLFGRGFYADTLSTPGYRMGDGKLVCFEMAHGQFTDTQPVVQYARTDDNLILQVQLGFRDTILPYGSGSLDTFSQIFLGLGKSDTITAEDKADMETAFRTKTLDAYGYLVQHEIAARYPNKKRERICRRALRRWERAKRYCELVKLHGERDD